MVARYMKFCASHPNGESLEAAFHSLDINPTSTLSTPTPLNPAKVPQHPTTQETPQEMSTILMAMRKLREDDLVTKIGKMSCSAADSLIECSGYPVAMKADLTRGLSELVKPSFRPL